MADKDRTMSVTLQGKRICARTFGLSVSIIDFTLSRINTGAYIGLLEHCDGGILKKKNIAPYMFPLPCFWVCQGPYDPSLVSAWEDWDAKYGSENDHPKDFTKDQCYIIFVQADGGRDLEKFSLLDYNEARSLLLQVTASAVAESACEFEHRDLHWGNILLARDEMADKDRTMSVTLQGKRICARAFGLSVSIIDFTLSRINTGAYIGLF